MVVVIAAVKGERGGIFSNTPWAGLGCVTEPGQNKTVEHATCQYRCQYGDVLQSSGGKHQ